MKDHKLRMVSWVFEGKGIATRKWDGVAIKVENGKVFRRYEWVTGKAAPAGFVKVQDLNPKYPHLPIPGWVPVPESFKTSPKGKDEQYLKEAWDTSIAILNADVPSRMAKAEVINPYAPLPTKNVIKELPNGTYELCGPDIHGNHDRFKGHVLLAHGATIEKKVPRTFEGLKKFLETYDGEGIVWHYNTGTTILMAKIKRRDFSFNVRVAPEDMKMAYRKDEPIVSANGLTEEEQKHVNEIATSLAAGFKSEEPIVATSEQIQESGFASVFEPDNPETGDDIHLTEVNPVLALL